MHLLETAARSSSDSLQGRESFLRTLKTSFRKCSSPFSVRSPGGGATFQKSENGSPKSSNIWSPTIGTCEVDAPSRRQCRHCLATANYRSRTFRSSTKKAVDPESRDLLLECLNKLPAMHRVILLLHETEGWTTDEIAALLKMKSGTVGRKLPEAKRLLGELGRRDIRGDAKKPDEGSD